MKIGNVTKRWGCAFGLVCFLLILTCPQQSFADESCGKLKSSDNYSDLNKILQCLESKISSKGAVSGNRDTTGEIDMGRFTVMISGGTKDEQITSLKLKIRNKLSEPLQIAYDGEQYPNIVDENGIRGKFNSAMGINYVVANSTGKNKESYTTILGNQILMTSLVFNMVGSKNNEIDLTMHLITFNNGKPEKITVSPNFTIRSN